MKCVIFPLTDKYINYIPEFVSPMKAAFIGVTSGICGISNAGVAIIEL